MRTKQNIAKNLAKTLGVSMDMLAGMLQVTRANLDNWGTLIDLNEFVQRAIKLGVKKELLLNLLVEPIEVEDEHSSSILHHIIHTLSDCDLNDERIQLFLDSTP